MPSTCVTLFRPKGTAERCDARKVLAGERIRIVIRLQGCFEPKASAFFNFQLALIVRNELLDFVGDREEIVPLLLVESDTKPAQPVDGNSALFTYFHTYRAGPPFLK